MTRIAQLIVSDGPGGAERIVCDLARLFTASGHPTVVFVPERGEGWIEQELGGSGVTIERFRLDRAVDPGFPPRLTRAFQAHGIQLAHSHEFSLSMYGAWAAWGAGIPHVMTMHGGRYHAAELRRRIALRAAAVISRAVVAVSESVAAQLADDLWMPRSRITVVPNGVRPSEERDSTLREELSLDVRERLVLAVGNLYPVKGHRYLVEALAILRSTGFPVHVAIAGRGSEESALRETARQLGVSERLHLLGLRSDIGNLLMGADVFAMPSLSEGLPLGLLEAMAAGCAIVATEVGEIPAALAQGDAGRLVPAKSPAALAEAIGKLLAHPALAHALGTRARDRATANFTVDRMAERYALLYGNLLKSAREERPATAAAS